MGPEPLTGSLSALDSELSAAQAQLRTSVPVDGALDSACGHAQRRADARLER